MRHPEPAGLTWRKSSYSSDHGGNCVEFARIGLGAAVRDSKNRDGGHLELTGRAWRALVQRL